MAEPKQILPDYQKVDGFTMPTAFSPECFRETLNFKPRPGDVFISTFPKCGTTWTQQIIYMIRTGGKTPEKGGDSRQSCPFLEMTGNENVDSMPDPRDFKIHLPFELAPYSAQAKYIVVVRNPKDTLVSFYHHTRSCGYSFENGDFNDYYEIFMNGDNDFGDYFDHIMSWYEHRNDPNVLYLYFEKMKADHKGTVLQIAKFLGPKYEEMVKDEDVLSSIIKYSSFGYMKKELNLGEEFFGTADQDIDSLPIPKGVKYMLKYLAENRSKSSKMEMTFVRKGIVGDWRNNFSEDQNNRMDEKISNRLTGTELLDFWNSIGCLT